MSSEAEVLEHPLPEHEEDDRAEIEAGWIAEARRRIEARRRGESGVIPWEDLRAELRSK